MPGPGSPQPQPSDHAGWCACPVLAAHTEIQRLTRLGLIVDGYDPARAYVIAALRERHGCRRGQEGVRHCYWNEALGFGSSGLRFDDRVPEISPPRPGRNTGEYL